MDSNNFNQQPQENFNQQPQQGTAPQYQQNQYQNQYQQPQYQPQFNPSELEKPYSIGQWIGSLLLMFIPFVRIIFLIVWAVNAENKSKKNFSIAMLTLWGIVTVLSLVLGIVLGALFVGVARSMVSFY